MDTLQLIKTWRQDKRITESEASIFQYAHEATSQGHSVAIYFGNHILAGAMVGIDRALPGLLMLKTESEEWRAIKVSSIDAVKRIEG